ncbi:hypothetical protein D0B54_07085 [Solimonas sp. K1W22B-7]|uniref:DUF3592 domain-containing protein n=1 Tax=Solimonas sp. K1W22B-7 TaxID=2303331 RepID=UPI000E330374|nr:DUF3592 domain-containing protein [Solimonas sp. K1W22B-7]AXQ28460.1 hypothetical protein D0B54_07085 [Solimonas sp. K1W22B-7]
MSPSPRFPPDPSRTAAPRGLLAVLGIALLGVSLVFGLGLVQELGRAATLDRGGRSVEARLLREQPLPAEGATRRRYLYEIAYEGSQRHFLSDEPLPAGAPLWVRYDPAAPLTADLYTSEPRGSALQYTGRLRLMLAWTLSGLLAAAVGLRCLRSPRQIAQPLSGACHPPRTAHFGI